MAKVSVLNGLKEEFESKTGMKYTPPAADASAAAGGGAKKPAAAAAVPAVNQAELDAKFKVIKSIGEECTKESDLIDLLKLKPDSFRLYDGFEPSGRMHIAQGIFKVTES
jgi:tyrosyl-tRNA synthetase